jgi:hypothetical protein
MSHVEGAAGIRTSLGQRVRSLPPTHCSPYLERHLLAKERERLRQEITRLERRWNQCRQRLADIEAQMASLAQRETGPKPAVSPVTDTQRTPGPLAKMTVEY